MSYAECSFRMYIADAPSKQLLQHPYNGPLFWKQYPVHAFLLCPISAYIKMTTGLTLCFFIPITQTTQLRPFILQVAPHLSETIFLRRVIIDWNQA